MDGFWGTYEGKLQRLKWMDGAPCPICHNRGDLNTLAYHNRRLECPARHSWSNPAALVDDLRQMATSPQKSTLDRPKLSRTRKEHPFCIARTAIASGDETGWRVVIESVVGEEHVTLFEGLYTSDRPIYCLLSDYKAMVCHSLIGKDVFKFAAWLIKNHGYQLDAGYAERLLIERERK